MIHGGMLGTSSARNKDLALEEKLTQNFNHANWNG